MEEWNNYLWTQTIPHITQKICKTNDVTGRRELERPGF